MPCAVDKLRATSESKSILMNSKTIKQRHASFFFLMGRVCVRSYMETVKSLKRFTLSELGFTRLVCICDLYASERVCAHVVVLECCELQCPGRGA